MKSFTEKELLKFARSRLPAPDSRVLVSFGDDSAVYSIPTGKFSCISTDAFVENIHFSLKYSTFYDIGVKSLVSALSDIAAIGGTPSVAVFSLFVRKVIYDVMLDDLYRGIRETAKKYWVNVVGGDTVGAEELAIVFTIVGEIEKSNITLRSGAKPGDVICVTGYLGDSYAGRIALGKKLDAKKYGIGRIIDKHLRPEARVKEAQKIISTNQINSMIDISDGLSTDLLHISEDSRVGVQLEAKSIPISEETIKVTSMLDLNPIETALKSGEEYELLFTTPEENLKKIQTMDIGIPITHIGKVTENSQKNIIIYSDGTSRPLKPTGYNHLA
jgi:thiamine-monophosphate kinase